MRQQAHGWLAMLLLAAMTWIGGCGGGEIPTGELSQPPAVREALPAPAAGSQAAAQSHRGQQTGSGEIEVLCGTSFGPPMEKLVAMYEKQTGNRALLVFGGSEDHLPKVKLQAAGDVYVTHRPYMQYTREADALWREVKVGFLAPVLVTAKGNPKHLARFEDLAEPGLGVVLPNPEFSTCGEMVFELLEKKGIKDAVLQNVGNDLVKHHATVGNQLKLGARDAGIMWNGVANNFRDALHIIPLAQECHEQMGEIGVSVMGLSYTSKRQLVKQFLDFIEQHGQSVFAEYGYTLAAGPEGREAGPPTRLTLYCGAGLRPAVAELAEQFGRLHGVVVETDYAGSEVLLGRIKLARRGDLYLPGDVYYVDLAADEGLIAARRTACCFVPVILVQKGNPKNIRTLQDLTAPGIKLGLGNPEACAVGRLSRKIFEKNGITKEQFQDNLVFESVTVNELGNDVKLKHLDAVIVWDAVAAYFVDDADTVAIPPEKNVVSTVVVGALSCSKHPELAETFLDFVAGPQGRQVFERHHYTVTLPAE